ncbi:hypothetical protein CTI12_AA263460 [Artemisia annua]|uniref:Uncharacterized protein n=1 Tax=Artemisia annua TaxID=35608 RepID=A0A2U1NIF2_ARTAN|nr:hypothetical protein CTI12_AA263460 [Artemisia annua]
MVSLGIESFLKLGDSIYFEEAGNAQSLYIVQYISSSLNWKSGKVFLDKKVEPMVSWDLRLQVTMTISSKKVSGSDGSKLELEKEMKTQVVKPIFLAVDVMFHAIRCIDFWENRTSQRPKRCKTTVSIVREPGAARVSINGSRDIRIASPINAGNVRLSSNQISLDALISGRTEPHSRRSKRSRQELAPEVITCRTTAASITPSSVNDYHGGPYVAISEYM